MNYVEKISILVCKQNCFNSFKNEITDKLIVHIMYIYLDKRKQMIDVKFCLLYDNTWNHLTVCKHMINSE